MGEVSSSGDDSSFTFSTSSTIGFFECRGLTFSFLAGPFLSSRVLLFFGSVPETDDRLEGANDADCFLKPLAFGLSSMSERFALVSLFGVDFSLTFHA